MTTDLRRAAAVVLALAAAACSDPATPAGPRDAGRMDAQGSFSCPDTLEAIQAEILVPSCGTAGCHASSAPAVALDLVSPGLEARLVGTSSSTCVGRTLVVAGDPEASLLVEKVAAEVPECGARMPVGSVLPQPAIDCLRAWVASLAPADAGVDSGPLDAGVDASLPRCESGMLECGGGCVDPSIDLAHCGGCDAPCGAGETCTAGACVCAGTLLSCDGACVDTTSDPAHCGACGAACAPGEVCSAGACGSTCPGGTTNCDGACVDTDTDALHCGSCTTSCGAGQACAAGACGCTGALELCAGGCVDTGTSELHCGACGTACAADETCAGGVCGCPSGTTECSGACVDTTRDPAHCGACGTVCSAGTACSGGTCGCGGGLSLCGSACVDTSSDPMHCGDCGTVCPSGTGCMAGTCSSCGPPSTLSGQVQPIFTARCATVACHAGMRPASDLSLVAGQAWGDLVDQPASACTDGRIRVEPFRADQSYLLNKLTGVGMCFGMQMPLTGTPLSAGEIDLVRSWVCRGARND